MVATVLLSFVAGVFSVLSPCVLPLAPIVMASALQRHAHGPLALAGGLVLSSTATGLTFASLGFVAGIDRDIARVIAAGLMAIVGVALLLPPLQDALTGVLTPLTRRAAALTTRVPAGLLGQFVLGVLLGAVWIPCTGPTLAAAVTLAARSESTARAGAVMVVFGLGAVVPLLLFAYGSRRTFTTRAPALRAIASVGKPVLGALLLVIGVFAFTGTDKLIETWMVNRMPEWLVVLTTRF